MKKSLIMFAVIGAALVSVVKCESEDGPRFELSERASAKVSKILDIKRSAMRLFEMRSENGKLGVDAEQALHELSMLLSPEEREAAKAHADSDLRAKIAVWALDREERKEEYGRFAKYYVNSPTSEEAMDYFWRPKRKYMEAQGLDPHAPSLEMDLRITPRPGTWEPNPVDEEDRKEEFRLILEYCFFMPPTGRKFDRDGYRVQMAYALLSLPHPGKSLVPIAYDAKLALTEPDGDPGRSIQEVVGGTLWLLGTPGAWIQDRSATGLPA